MQIVQNAPMVIVSNGIRGPAQCQGNALLRECRARSAHAVQIFVWQQLFEPYFWPFFTSWLFHNRFFLRFLCIEDVAHLNCRPFSCNKPAWATRTGLQEPSRDRAFARRRRQCQSGIRTEKEREKLCVTLFCGCLFMINSVLGILLVVVDMLHGGVPKSPNCPRS